MVNETLKVWAFDRDIAVDIGACVALDELEHPDLEAVLLAARGDVITVQVVEGGLPDRQGVLYVARRGLYEVLRSETWPAATEGGSPRLLLTLKAWPST